MTSYEPAWRAARATEGKPLTGLKVLGMLVAFFGVVAGVNGLMIYFAVSSFRGEVEAKPYEHGLAYNREIEQARAQAQRDWRVDAKVTRLAHGVVAMRILLRDRDGKPLPGVAVQATLASPADRKQDVAVALVEGAPGRFEGDATLAGGWRDLVIVATQNGREAYRSKNRILIEDAP
jgi:nitrogen fixation protein FixH